ncbi:MAG: Rieske (2Fe-2S) protein [Sphingomonadales bacterium]|nr:Rieske (2Fe-2S) protein [Sphingomonadales bacterium]
MDRKKFLSQLGVGGAGLFATCLSSCSKNDTQPPNVDFQLDLSTSAYASLKIPGNFLVVQGVIIALSSSNVYFAVSASCPHQGVQVQFQPSQNQFICPAHNSLFTSSGARISGPAPNGLTRYNTSLNGNILRIFS